MRKQANTQGGLATITRKKKLVRCVQKSVNMYDLGERPRFFCYMGARRLDHSYNFVAKVLTRAFTDRALYRVPLHKERRQLSFIIINDIFGSSAIRGFFLIYPTGVITGLLPPRGGVCEPPLLLPGITCVSSRIRLLHLTR